MDDARLILDIFVINGYAAKFNISQIELANGSQGEKYAFQYTSCLPANLWSYQVLSLRNDKPKNDFVRKVLEELAYRSGFLFESVTYSMKTQIDTCTNVIMSKRFVVA